MKTARAVLTEIVADPDLCAALEKAGLLDDAHASLQVVASDDLDSMFDVPSDLKEKAAGLDKAGAYKVPKELQQQFGSEEKARKAVSAAFTGTRQGVVRLLKAVDPKGYEEYKARKFAGTPEGERPPIEQSRAAYLWAFERALNLVYVTSGE